MSIFEEAYEGTANELFKRPALYVLLASFSIALLSWYLQWRKARKHMYDLAKLTPYPHNVSMYPIIGHAHLFSGGNRKIFKNICRIIDNQDSPRVVWLGHRLYYTVKDPVDLEIILNSRKAQAKDELYYFAWTVIGQGLFAAPLEKWKRNRKLIAPAFSKKNIDDFVSIFSEQAEVFCDVLKQHDGKDYFDCESAVANWAIDSISETAMGLKANCQTTESMLAFSIHRCMEILMIRMFNIVYHNDILFNLTNISREENTLKKYLHSFTEKVISEKKEEHRQRNHEKLTLVEAEIDEVPKKKAFIDLLIDMSDNGAVFNDQELRDEVQTFLAAGSDTSATAINFIMVTLGMFPQYQQKVYEEALDVLGPDRILEYTDIPKLVYTEKFIKETMRLFPVGPNIVRKVTDGDLQLTTCTIPEGAGIMLGFITNHRNAKYFPDPLRFDPERFNPEEITKRHPYCYLPFSGGSRNCVGIKYAMASMKALVATTVRRFFIETSYKSIEDIEYKQALLIRAIRGYPIKVTSRQ